MVDRPDLNAPHSVWVHYAEELEVTIKRLEREREEWTKRERLIRTEWEKQVLGLMREKQDVESALVEALIPLEVIRAEAPHIRLGPLRKKLKLFSSELEAQVVAATDLGRAVVAAQGQERE